MPFPPPPPPPGPPPPPSFTPPAPDGRGQLLQSIRQGTPLKKTVTNDKSAPTISGRVQGASESEGVSVGGGGSRGGAPLNGSATLGRANGLGGLFANGMPKLKPTGLDIGQTQNSQSLTSLPSATASGNNEQTRRQFNVDIKNRGPPPKPPPANQKPSMPQETGTVARARPRSTYSPVTPLPNLYQTFSTTSKDPTTSTADFQSFNTRSYDTNNTISTNDWKSHTYFKFPNINTIRLSNDVSSNKAQSTLNIPIDFYQLSSLSLNNFPNAKSPPPQFKLRSPPINMSVNNFPNAKSPPPQFKLRSPPINMSVNNFPNAKSPPPQFKLRSPPFNIPPAPLNRNFMTFPIRMHQVGTASSRPSSPLSRKPMFSISPLNTADPLSPPTTPKRDEYNRFKSASSTFHSATLPPKLSIPIEFTIQRPRLTVLPIRSENSARSTSDSVLTGSGALHNRSSSTVSLAQAQGPRSHKAPPGGHGKPNVAPKPPGIKPPGRPTRTQSMRVPRSPPVAPPTGQSPFIPNKSELHRGAFYQSQDSLLHTPPPPKHNTMPSPRGAPVRPPLRPPQTRPPPPPPNKLVMTPPPPPSAPPPPPPHRVPLPPLPTVFQPTAGPAPPPPPTRHSSMRNGMPSSFSSKLEARFAERFHMREEFPPPQPFLGVTKVYNSRTAKQPAPQPPQHVQLVWSRDQHDNSSSC